MKEYANHGLAVAALNSHRGNEPVAYGGPLPRCGHPRFGSTACPATVFVNDGVRYTPDQAIARGFSLGGCPCTNPANPDPACPHLILPPSVIDAEGKSYLPEACPGGQSVALEVVRAKVFVALEAGAVVSLDEAPAQGADKTVK